MSKPFPQILFVEDDPDLLRLTRDYLIREGLHVICAQTGNEALERIQREKFDLFLLDIMLPEADGYELAKAIRQNNKRVPIIFLSALHQLDNKLSAFELEADDYITKPFELKELKARIDACVRRLSDRLENQLPSTLHVQNVELNPHFIAHGRKRVSLQKLESKLLFAFFSNANKVIPKDWLLEHIWSKNTPSTASSLDVHLHHIRRKLAEVSTLEIQTVRGIGYRLNVTDDCQ